MENDPDLRRLREEIRRQREMIERLEEENRRRMVTGQIGGRKLKQKAKWKVIDDAKVTNLEPGKMTEHRLK